jgi:hypothetical protein
MLLPRGDSVAAKSNASLCINVDGSRQKGPGNRPFVGWTTEKYGTRRERKAEVTFAESHQRTNVDESRRLITSSEATLARR